MRERFGNTFAAILVGGSRPEDLPSNGEPLVIGTSARGRHMAHLRLVSSSAGATGEVAQVVIEPTIAADENIATLIDQVRGVDGASSAPSGHGRREPAPTSARPTASETPAQQTQDSEKRVQHDQEDARSTASPALSESGGNTRDAPKPIIIGDNLRVGMPLQEVFVLLGAPASTTVEQGTAAGNNRVRMEFPAHGLVLVTTHELVLEVIEVQPAFTGQFPSGVRLGDPVTAIITAYGMPASMTPKEARYPDKGFLLIFDDAKLIHATVSRPLSDSQRADKPVETPGKSPAEEKPSPPPQPGMASPPSGPRKDAETESGAQVPAQETTRRTAEPATQQPQEAQAAKPHPRIEIALPGGKLEAVLAKDVTASTEPVSPTSEFPEDVQEIYLMLKSELAHSVVVQAHWIAVDVEGIQRDQKLSHSRLRLNAGQRGAIGLKAPRGGFSLGEYRVDIVVNTSPVQSLSFTVVPILRGLPKNLASPALEGAIVRFTSQHGRRYGVHRLIDGRTDTPGWRSADGYLPQEFVFAFRGDQVILIDQIILNPKADHDPTTGPKRITVSVSTEHPLDGFQEVGQFTLLQEPRDQAFPIGRLARFVRLRILENFGGQYTSLGEVQVIEGLTADYQSALRNMREAPAVSPGTGVSGLIDEAEVIVENEPNGTPAQANPLEIGRTTKGVIDPLGEEDYFKLTIPGTALSAVTLDLLGKPNIRTSLTLFDAAGKSLKRFNPGAVPAERATFSWAVAPGEHVLQVTEPSIAMVLIWDTSGSMKGSTEALRQAVETYLDQVRPSERLNLIRFSGRETEVLLPEFTGDRERLKAATVGKIFASGGTPFYDAVAKGIELLQGAWGNRAIVVLTDGSDVGSRLDHPGFWRLLQEKRIRLYTIGLGKGLRRYKPEIASTSERHLTHAAMATNGRFFFAPTAEALQGLYQQIAAELQTLSTYYVRPTLSRGPGRLQVVATGERMTKISAPPQLELILDASGSMKRKIGGRMMIDIAKDAMAQIIEGLPDELQVALRVYGHRIRERQRGDCQDSELMFPFAKIDKPRLVEQVRRIQALGTTPIAYSLQQVERDFGAARGEKMLILVTDGKEECKGNPSAVVSGLLAKGFQLRLNVVGFALADEATKREMQHIAALTGGHFFDAKDAKALHGAIAQALAVPYDVLDAAGSPVASGVIGQGAIAVPEGIYTIVVRAAGTPITVADVRVAYDQFTRVELKKEGQEVGMLVLGPVQRHETPWAVEAAAAPPSPRHQ